MRVNLTNSRAFESEDNICYLFTKIYTLFYLEHQ